MVLPIKVSLDNLILYVAGVSLNQFNGLLSFFSKYEKNPLFSEVYKDFPFRYKETGHPKKYRMQMNIGFGEGAFTIQYAHNGSISKDKEIKGRYPMRIEFNPAKTKILDSKDYGLPEPLSVMIFKAIRKYCFDEKLKKNDLKIEGNRFLIKGMDFAFDFPVHMDKVVWTSLTGRVEDRYKGTKYLGSRGKHGYTKLYNKKKEREDNKDKIYEKYEEVTRFEYTLKYDKPVLINEIRNYSLNLNDEIKVCILDEREFECDPITKACLLAYINNLMPLSEFTRTYKTKIKRALDNLNQINIDKILKTHWDANIIADIQTYLQMGI